MERPDTFIKYDIPNSPINKYLSVSSPVIPLILILGRFRRS